MLKNFENVENIFSGKQLLSLQKGHVINQRKFTFFEFEDELRDESREWNHEVVFGHSQRS